LTRGNGAVFTWRQYFHRLRIVAMTVRITPRPLALAFLVMALDQMISYVYMGCQMGDQNSCMNAQMMQQQGANLIGAGQYCYQTNDPNACAFYQQGVMQVQNAYGMMMQSSGGQMTQMPGVDPGNPLGATHDQRMANIAAWGAQNTQNWQNGMAANEASVNSFLDNVIRN
jgi:hypothetical protein